MRERSHVWLGNGRTWALSIFGIGQSLANFSLASWQAPLAGAGLGLILAAALLETPWGLARNGYGMAGR